MTHMTHWLLKITGQQIKHLGHVEVEDKHAEKNFMGTDHLVPERGHYKAIFREKLKRTKDYDYDYANIQ